MIADFMIGPFILMYHSISNDPHDAYTVSVTAFREQISWLSDHEFDVVPLSFLLRSIQAKDYESLRRKVVITFDDGYQDFVTNAMSVLLDHSAPATVFLVTDMLGGKATWEKTGIQKRLLSKEDARSLKEQGFHLGSHTATHANLVLLPQDEVQQQLRNSCDMLTRLGESFYAFSYPWGQWSVEVVGAVKAAGFECAVAVGENTRLATAYTYLLPRVAMTYEMDIKRFQSLMTRTRLERELRRTYWNMRGKIFGPHKKMA
jgi:peptidoglycan/xylan/chitin deacetylase (PgdA/CDA1 family)